jgi:hypothetical protein
MKTPGVACMALVVGLLVVPGGVLLAGFLAEIQSPRSATAQGDASLGCDSNNPRFAVALAQRSRKQSEPAVVGLRDTRANRLDDRLTIADASQLGSVYGLAYDPLKGELYAAAFARLDAEFGPGGPGAIYRIDLSSGATSHWFTLSSTPRDLDPRDQASILPRVGQVGLGDIELDYHSGLLFVSDLTQQRVRVISTATRRELTSFPHGAYEESWAANARLFGLEVYDGYVYHGLVDSRLDPSLDGELHARVYRSRYDGSEMTEVAAFALDYRSALAWQPWRENFRGIRERDL